MSERSMKRARQRQAAKDEKRAARLRGKAAAGAGAALGATVLFAPSAQAESFTVTTLADNSATPPEGSLRDRLADADADPGFDIVNFQPGLSGTITLDGSQLVLREDIEVRGPGRDVITVNANDQSRVFYFSPGDPNSNRPSIISGLTITGGNSNDANGGGIYAFDGNLILEDVLVTGNETLTQGGGIFARQAGLEIHDSTISGNTAGTDQVNGSGGGIYVDQDKYGDFGPFELDNTTVSGNTSSGEGGGIYLYDLYQGAEIRNATISGNTAGNEGGGIYLYNVDENSVLDIEDTRITGNTATGSDGGGVRLGGEDSVDGTVRLTDSTVSGNQAGDDGGGIYLYQLDSDEGQFLVRGSTISGNTADDDGGGVYVEDSDGLLRFSRSTISGNTAGERGGGVYLENVAYDRPGYQGPYNYYPGTYRGVAHFVDSTIASNTAAEGGGVFNDGDQVLLRNTIAADNTNDDLQETTARFTAQTFLLDFSLVEDVGDAAVTEEKTEGSNIIGQDPQLGPLADNGGPTQTHAPAFSSPVVDQGSSNALVDQRYFQRPFDQPDRAQPNLPGADASDIGAVELQAAPPVPQGSCLGRDATVVLAPPGEVTFGTAGQDVIVGDAAANEIRGRGGNDLICGRGGRDQIGGGPGNDVVLGNDGNDVLSGDQDDDRLTGSDGNDKLSGATGDDRMYGVNGRDRLTGAAGDDHLNGGAQDDVLIGASGADNLFGAGGNDRLNGGKGIDNLTGGGGRDQEIQQRR